jgi:DNA-binding NarL/FixJ family response regulator
MSPERAAWASKKSESTLKILLADESREFRKFIRRLSEPEVDLEVVGEASSGQELVPLARRLKPNVVVLDIALSGIEGLQGARSIKAELPETRIVLLSVVDEPALRDAAQRYGADVFVSKDAQISDIFSYIRGKGPVRARR